MVVGGGGVGIEAKASHVLASRNISGIIKAVSMK
jgi:hypothetical protein